MSIVIDKFAQYVFIAIDKSVQKVLSRLNNNDANLLNAGFLIDMFTQKMHISHFCMPRKEKKNITNK